MPWLKKIDANRVYSNMGPLWQLFAERLGQHFQTGSGTVLPVANGTLGLATALLAAGVTAGQTCLLPAWTFVASGHAVRAAGLEPCFVDVDEHSGMLTPDIARRQLATASGRVGAVMVVSPFGAPVDLAGWEMFRQETGIPVVVDAAAGFDTVRPTALAVVVSLHATKIFGIGEGGFILSTDTAFIRECQRASNFGFLGNRSALIPAINAKMSEYNAAIGLAGLEMWPESRANYARVCARLAKHLGARSDVNLQAGWGEDWVSATCVARFAVSALLVETALAGCNIETRRWWGDGLQAHPAFADCAATPLPVTVRLAQSSLGLPCCPDLTTDNIDYTIAALASVLDERASA
ncbi:MAG: DegT/DnrJ/EryC1/StrS aminotransferase family protein [Rhizobiales bacterium]|nr:DegT/DnrJ/EryC1/StrS aminotransferase family protein [Hyphomicrobiales bacterium]